MRFMAAKTKVNRAWDCIEKMPFGCWIETKVIAKDAGLTVHAMSRYLHRAKIFGLVDRKEVRFNSMYHSMWRRISLKPTVLP